ncbi:uncharacterized protein PITG_12045 [Phytophthora infestans T30-4]|uniref:C2H2-type domain-containing protein n=1 Tax=Phytophthora infestans (strain T30-4) TaxID=403677 RepID=D0NHS8_PHYIT|nr:uncharacterized protein PITG_12045 [Phytophthora infestans T30-4]EEY59003.1 hypothetical protein PITG_12045 [Phytophthora infestans T30-4]|eukprot:XP_002901476.1 hypothetical protein PITG_12045 [Phytophthora infestans T30-4]
MALTSSQICSMLFPAVRDNMHTCTTCGKTYMTGIATQTHIITCGAAMPTTSNSSKKQHAVKPT